MEFLGSLIPLIQLVLALLLVASVLLQQSGASVGGSFGGGEGANYYTRRGFEKTLFRATILIAFLFAVSAFAALIL